MKRDALSLATAVLAVTVLNVVVYGDAGSADFINWDDDVYVVRNPLVAGGLSIEGWREAWAFDTPPYYMPLTWLSFLVNAELAGVDPGAYHLTNVILHTASSVLLLLVLRLATGDMARSLFVAALFAAHPLHVEGVMWVAQRKEMLSTFFGMLMLLAYCAYARRTAGDGGPTVRAWYLSMLLALLMSLLSKPMWLTAPALLLLLDVWPLRRLHVGVSGLLLEKLPVLAICVLVLAVNVVVVNWDAAQLVESMDVRPFAAGWETIPISYIVFLWKTFVPYPLAVPYTSFHEPLSPALAVGSIGLLVALTVLAVRARRRAQWIIVGWLWFIVSAATVLFSFGSGKMTPLADHWTYVPHIGLFAAMAWSLPLDHRAGRGVQLAAVAGCLAIVTALGAMAYAQTRHWQDAPALWSHSIAVTERNYTAYWLWGVFEWEAGRHEKGEQLMREAQRLNPAESFYVHRLGRMLLSAKRKTEALAELRRLLEPPLASPRLLTSTGITALRAYGPAEAKPFLSRAIMLAADDDVVDLDAARFYLWMALIAQGRSDEADAVLGHTLAARGEDRAAFCEEARATVRHLVSLDPRWARYVQDIETSCPAPENSTSRPQPPPTANTVSET